MTEQREPERAAATELVDARERLESEATFPDVTKGLDSELRDDILILVNALDARTAHDAEAREIVTALAAYAGRANNGTSCFACGAWWGHDGLPWHEPACFAGRAVAWLQAQEGGQGG